MKTRLLLKIRFLSRNLSVRAGLFCFAAIVAALAAVAFAPAVSDDLARLLGGKAVDDILTVLASSMLAVVTFSLSTLISTYAAVGSGAPPRATTLLIEDARAQNALSSFLGAFIFSIVSLVALSTGYYGPKGRVILFFITIFVLAVVIWTIIRWIGQLSELTRLGNVIGMVENMTEKTLAHRDIPFAWETALPEWEETKRGVFVSSRESGFVQAVDFEELAEFAEKSKRHLFVEATPGRFVHPHFPLVRVEGTDLPEETAARLRNCFVLAHQRTFEGDARFGFIVLSEIASRALSPAINDPGTAIHVIESQVRLILNARETGCRRTAISDYFRIRQIDADEIFDDAFRAIARDGAALVEVGVFLQKSLSSLGHFPEFADAAARQARDHLSRCRQAMTHEADLVRVTAASEREF